MANPATEQLTDDPAVARGTVLLAFGETIMRFQILELSFWAILSMRLKDGMTMDQAMAKVGGWDRLTTGQLVGVLGLPEDLKAEADEAVSTRNYLAHRYMRERAMFLSDPAFCEQMAQELLEIQQRLDGFEERLAAYKRNLGVPELTDEELGELGSASHRARPSGSVRPTCRARLHARPRVARTMGAWPTT
jgi:hypothetical protein